MLRNCVENESRDVRRRLWLLTLLSIFPLRTSFLYGQMHILVLFCLTLEWYFHKRERDSVSGILIAIAGALKIYPHLFWVYFFFCGSTRCTSQSLSLCN